MKLLKYKNLLGSYDFDPRDNVFIGKILGIEGYFSFFGETEEETIMETNFDVFFEESMQDKKLKQEYKKLEPKYEVIRQIIRLRKESGLSQEELSKLTGISRVKIKQYEGGITSPSMKSLNRIANACGKKLTISFI